MKALKLLCSHRDSVFDVSKQDTAPNLSHLLSSRIDAKSFLEENYVTDGMKTLLTESFRRLQGKSEQALFKLTQAMGGGKTHTLITLGLFARTQSSVPRSYQTFQQPRRFHGVLSKVVDGGRGTRGVSLVPLTDNAPSPN